MAPLRGAGASSSGISSQRRSEHLDVGDILLLDVPHRGDVVGYSAPLQGLPEIIRPRRHFQELESVVEHPCLVGVLDSLVCRMEPIASANAWNALPLQVLVLSAP